ncbi:hypothetical protein ACQKWADRAFT_305654 [Trichoderma austrokoningii]
MRVEYLQRDQKAENTEQEPGLSTEEQRSRFGLGLRCAALTPQGQCNEPAIIPCQICQLVAYCSEECMKKDAKRHSRKCPPPTEPPSRSEPTSEVPDDPVKDAGSFWASYAATDVLNLAQNEGAEYNGYLRILLAGPFGLRHLIYSVVALPETADPLIEVTISETQRPHLYRTFLSLIILWRFIELDRDPYEAADLVIHAWYSYKWPHYLVDFLEKDMMGLFQKPLASSLEGIDLTCLHKYAYKKAFYSRIMRVDVGFTWTAWADIHNYMMKSINQDYIDQDIHTLREEDVKANGEPLDTAFARMSPSRVAALVKWRQTGVMLAHGDSPLVHDYYNPIFFFEPSQQPLPKGFTNEPLSEWPMNEILDHAPYAAEADVYGKMIAYVRELLVKFQLRMKTKRGLHVKLSCTGDVQMEGQFERVFGEDVQFDRIEGGNSFDLQPLLCLLSFSRLLRHTDENPFATLLIMTRESFTKSQNLRAKKMMAAEKKKIFEPVSQSLDAIAPPVQTTDNKYSAALCVHRHFALLVFDREWDSFSDRYLGDESLFTFHIRELGNPKRNIFDIDCLGLQFKKKNTVKSRWQNRLMPTSGKILTERDARNLRRWMSWPTTKPERWLEWKKVTDLPGKLWSTRYSALVSPNELQTDERENVYGFLTREAIFLRVELDYEKCDCGMGHRHGHCGHEQAEPTEEKPKEEPKEEPEEEPEDESWMEMDPAESSTAGGADQKSKGKKKKGKGKKGGKK